MKRELISRSYQYYEKAYQRLTVGPQHEGLSEKEFQSAIADSRSLTVDVELEDGTRVLFPILSPVEHTGWYNQKFFENHAADFGHVFHFCVPPALVDRVSEQKIKEIHRNIGLLQLQNVSIVFDEKNDSVAMSGQLSSLLDGAKIQYKEIFLGDDAKSPSRELYFVGTTKIVEKKYNPFSEKKYDMSDVYKHVIGHDLIDGYSTTKLFKGSELSREQLEKLWNLYEEPFQKLIENDPLRVALKKDEFTAILRDESSLSIVHEKQGMMVTSCHMVTKPETCKWLNPNFYKEKFPDKYNEGLVWYFPGIVTDINSRGGAYSQKVIGLLSELVSYGRVEPIIVFDCTEISARYIPLLVARSINRTEALKISIADSVSYNYRLFKI
jgi:hypothetical protein